VTRPARAAQLAAEEAPLTQTLLRSLPQVQKLLETPAAAALCARFSRALVVAAVREQLAGARRALLAGDARPFFEAAFFTAVERVLLRRERGRLRRVVNATGIVIHTNLGRAPLAESALRAVYEAGVGYANLEFDLETGERGSRYTEVETLLKELTGAEAALVVNNNAAAVLLALSALAQPGEVVISRGELVEIGGGFRVPDVIRQGGAVLVEVGSTNKTRLSDYEAALTPATRLLLKVHPSNYRMEGFVGSVSVADLAELAHVHGLPLMEDAGSGALVDLAPFGLPAEPVVADSVRAGADLVAFSGDKLLSGPQAGLLVGRAELIGRLKKHPLLRALRIDKLSLAALSATLRLYRDEARVQDVLPVLRMMTQSPEVLAERAERLRVALAALPKLDTAVVDGLGYAGGGALPGSGLPGKLVTVQARGIRPTALAAGLRAAEPPVIGRLSEGVLALDVRTVRDEEVADIVRAFRGLV
jgi:L-seryl-tRNA(Ser) seleniumtransferase